MAISSFDKKFVLNSEKALHSFGKIVEEKPEPIIVDRSRTSP